MALTSKDDEVDELLGLKLELMILLKNQEVFHKSFNRKNKSPIKKNNIVDDTKNIISHGKLKFDPAQLEEWNAALPDKLTTMEFLIVKELAKRPGVIKKELI